MAILPIKLKSSWRTLVGCGLLLLQATGMRAQSEPIVGRVTAADGGQPLEGASIVVKGTGMATQTDQSGNFRIQVSLPAQLTVSYTGYFTREIPVRDGESLSIVLTPDELQLDEVVVVGYGQQRKSTLTGAVSTVGNRELVRAPVSNVTNAITGRIPGVFTAQRSGKPGDNQADIFIRGQATTGSSAALIIVDGAERQSFGDIDPNEIESISVLKDASATALFGIKGGNGVILVTTKSGREGKARINYTGSTALQTFSVLPKTLDAFTSASLLNEAYGNVGQSPAFTQAELEKFRDQSDPLRYPDFNWFDYITRDYYPQTQHNLNVSGGTKRVKYFVSGGYLFEDGILERFDNPYGYQTTPNYSRYNFRSNVDMQLTEDLDISVRLGGRLERRYAPAGDPFYRNAEFEYLLSRVNAIPAYAFLPTLPDGRFMENPSAGVNLTNPLGWITRRGYFVQQNNAIESTLILNYNLGRLVKGLSFKGLYAYDGYFGANRRQEGSFTSYYINKETGDIIKGNSSFSQQDMPLGAVQFSYDGRMNYNLQTSLNYDNRFGIHQVTGLLLFQRQTESVMAAEPAFASQGLIGRVTYNYDDRYFAEVNAAYNGSENFAAGHRYGFFPAVSAGWNIGNEPFMRQVEWVDALKLRGSYGQIGFDRIGGNRFLYLEEYSRMTTLRTGAQGPYSLPNSATQFGYPTSVITYPSIIHARIGNPLITWETSTKRNIGLETSFLKGMFRLNADVFNEDRTGILLNRESGLATYGEPYPSVNFGEVHNKGYELELGYRHTAGTVTYGVNTQYSFARNRIISRDEPPGRPAYQKAAGYRIGQFRGYLTDGFYRSIEDIGQYTPTALGSPIPGDLKFVDYNRDGIINADDIAPIGYANVPEVTYSVEPFLHYRGFAFSMMLQGVDNVSTNLWFDQRWLSSNQMYSHMLGRWTPENADNASWPALQPAVGGNFMSYELNDFLLTDASFLRIRNVEIAFSLPQRFVNRLRLNNLRVFMTGQNLYTWTKVQHLDPENFQRRAPQAATNVYPTSRIYNLGVNLEF